MDRNWTSEGTISSLARWLKPTFGGPKAFQWGGVIQNGSSMTSKSKNLQIRSTG